MARWVLSKGAGPAGVSEPQHGLAVRGEGGGFLGVTWALLSPLCLSAFADFPPWWKPR